ncbi:S-adenosyl-L-methionine-dependent methyltransferase [Rhodocollybia butyracea]|uniref:S-adenosyl-L-methionine-dependent methyltransferase n=1 Tax=Rhodocollybia butyracea TaxID=206335 RepID=A0A9P5PUD6_9AGAR|nr:S-adenosyl-L-methionine-dependent methyltransferase [Rhodocollybia butyracea]
MSDPLTALLQIISTQTTVLQTAYSKADSSVPSINTPFQPTPLEFDPRVTEARHLIVAAATQLIATVQSPIEFLQAQAGGMFDTVIVGFIIDVNVPEILREAGPEGLHVDDLSTATGVDASYLARVLRYLATRHIFKETSPNVFAHNRPSSLLTKAKSIKEIQKTPTARFDNAPIAAYLHLGSDELLTSSTAFSSFLKNPKQAAAPFNVAYNTPKKMWDWFEEDELRSRRFTAAMKNSADAMFRPEIFTSGINGDALNPDDVVVDVGGNIGPVTLTLYKAFPKLRYIVQDLGQQVVAGEKFWNEKAPQALKSGRVQLQAHDFFTPQPIKDAAIYMLRLIIHDWCDEDAKKILSQLRSAAGSQSKLILFEMLAKHVSENPTDGTLSAPYPLLPNLGVAKAGFFTTLDMSLLTMYNGKERTYEEYAQLGKESGWKLEEVKPGKICALVFSPI